MTDVGDSVDRVESLLEELVAFQKSSHVCICYHFIFSLLGIFAAITILLL